MAKKEQRNAEKQKAKKAAIDKKKKAFAEKREKREKRGIKRARSMSKEGPPQPEGPMEKLARFAATHNELDPVYFLLTTLLPITPIPH